MAGARSVCAVAGLVVSFSASAEPIVSSFETLTHGEIITNQFADVGMAIEAVNFEYLGARPVVFNSNFFGTADPDLEGPLWSKGNLAPFADLGNVLIIPENLTDANNDGIVDAPDDEGARPAGELRFSFESVMTAFGFDVIDMEGPVREASSIEFLLFGQPVASVSFNEFVTQGSDFYDPTVRFGDHSANRIAPISAERLGIEGFTAVVLHIGGSSAYDNIVAVPAPAASAVLAGAGLLMVRRRRN